MINDAYCVILIVRVLKAAELTVVDTPRYFEASQAVGIGVQTQVCVEYSRNGPSRKYNN